MVQSKEFKERVTEFAASQGMSVAQLQRELGLSNAHFQNTSRVTPRVAALLRGRFPGVSTEWLNTGRGEMILPSPDWGGGAAEVVAGIPLLPVSAQGGTLGGWDCQVSEYECERILSPVRNAELAMPVTGDSMAPEYPSGSIVFIRRINDASLIDWGHTFVLDTPNGVVIKKLLPGAEADCVVCRSVNPDYPDFSLPRSEIRAWYRVLASLTMK